MSNITKFYRTPALSDSRIADVFGIARSLGMDVQGVTSEYCYYVEAERALGEDDHDCLSYLLAETYNPQGFGRLSFLNQRSPNVIEVGPRLNFETPWSSAAVEICRRSGVDSITRLERSIRFEFFGIMHSSVRGKLEEQLRDRMTEMVYLEPLRSFETGLVPAPVRIVPLEELESFNKENGCSWDDDDKKMIEDLFLRIGRNPTDVELFQIAQANSDHSRHWFFRGKLVLDGTPVPEKNLMEIIRAPLEANPGNSVIAFCDDSSAIEGFSVKSIGADDSTTSSPLRSAVVDLLPTLTAETHNFPTGVAPFPGAATGTGGRIRDNQAVGRGGHVRAGSAGYMTGNLMIPGRERNWEAVSWTHPSDLASPLDILIQASNGASAYGNCFGEPVIYGTTREVGIQLPDGSYTSYFKPIMYTSGAGFIDARHTKKGLPEKGMLIVQVGGPAYRIGMGGSAASSMEQGANSAELDFNAVQRGNPEMEQRVNRVLRGCIEMGNNNPIISAHDLGAGGDSNALPEIAEPAGAKINIRALPVGDASLSILEIWGNESQERNALLVWPEGYEVIKALAERENVEALIVGQITGDGYLIVHDENDGTDPVNLPMDELFGQRTTKVFNLETVEQELEPLVLPADLTFEDALTRVLSRVEVGSKAFLTRKVDRSVTGLIAQQQCCGPLQTTISDYATIALGYEDNCGITLSLGEQPVIGLVDPAAGARMTLAESILNLAGTGIQDICKIKAEANWMLAARKPGEGAKLYRAACALRDMAIDLGIAFDGGKDSCSMASQGIASDGTSQSVKAPLTLVVAPYAPVDDITKGVTPDLKKAGNYLFHLPLTDKLRLGGSALALAHGQLGDECPDIDDVSELIRVFLGVQALIKAGVVESIHDVSTGGLIVTLLEMAIAGNKGVTLDLAGSDLFASCFAEEAGLIIEVNDSSEVSRILKDALPDQAYPIHFVGEVRSDQEVEIYFCGEQIVSKPLSELRSVWEATSFQIDGLQANPQCVGEERQALSEHLVDPDYRLTYKPSFDGSIFIDLPPRAAILREEGSNGDREMAAAFKAVGFEVWDVTMTDLISGRVSLRDFQLIAFVGGFSFGDVLDSGKGWASVIRHNERVADEFLEFFARPDTLSLGVCNGCQVMALMGIPGLDLADKLKPRFITNLSERFESRFSTIEVLPSPSILLDEMVGSRLGIWVAHGEGRLHADEAVLQQLVESELLPLRFVDNTGQATMSYPFNPNGSPGGFTAICSPDGRHLAMMPHPERLFLPWQWPWMPESWKDLAVSPWLKLFQNAIGACK